MLLRPLRLAGALMLSLAALPVAAATLSFEPHAIFFSTETKQVKPVDPQVFVKADVPSGPGPQGIVHNAGVRPALIDQDAKTTALFASDGHPLGFDLGIWLGATGTATLTPAANGTKIDAEFAGLRPNGVYGLFENHFDQSPVGFTPLDGTGDENSFTASADGKAHVTLTAPGVITHANALLLVYHSDGKNHGTMRGMIGLDAHHQLIVRPQ